MSFYTSLTGLQAATTELSVTSNNIANAGTSGFKRAAADFGQRPDGFEYCYATTTGLKDMAEEQVSGMTDEEFDAWWDRTNEMRLSVVRFDEKAKEDE